MDRWGRRRVTGPEDRAVKGVFVRRDPGATAVEGYNLYVSRRGELIHMEGATSAGVVETLDEEDLSNIEWRIAGAQPSGEEAADTRAVAVRMVAKGTNEEAFTDRASLCPTPADTSQVVAAWQAEDIRIWWEPTRQYLRKLLRRLWGVGVEVPENAAVAWGFDVEMTVEGPAFSADGSRREVVAMPLPAEGAVTVGSRRFEWEVVDNFWARYDRATDAAVERFEDREENRVRYGLEPRGVVVRATLDGRVAESTLPLAPSRGGMYSTRRAVPMPDGESRFTVTFAATDEFKAWLARSVA